MIEIPETSKDSQLEEIKDLLHILISEIQELRKERLPASPENIEVMLAALFVIFSNSEFTAAWILETSLDNDPDAVRLLRAISETIGKRPTVQRLSRFLKQVIGTYNDYRLEIANHHGRDGTTFIINVIE